MSTATVYGWREYRAGHAADAATELTPDARLWSGDERLAPVAERVGCAVRELR